MSQSKGLLINLSWKFAERISAQLVSFVVSIILARLLSPSDYGSIAMVTIFITLANVLVEGGFSSALIQKKDADKLDYSTVFYFSLIFSAVLYVVLFFTAPAISRFYGEGYEILTPVLRVLGVTVIVYGINSVQQAYIAKNMMFRKFFWATLIGTICSAAVGLIMAYSGFGIWSLVAQQLTMSFINVITLFLTTRKLPGLLFSFERFKGLFNYGIKLFGASILVTGYQELRALIIGKLYLAKDLAFYDKGRQFPNLIVANINTSIGTVLFPKLSDEQDNIIRVKQTTRNSIRFSAYLMCPLMLGLMAISEPFIRVLLTDKWISCVPILRLFCIVYLFQPIHTANMQAIKAIGRSDVYLKLEIIKKAIELITLVAVMWISVKAIVINMAVLTSLFTFVNAFPNKRLLNYSFFEQVLDITPAILMSFIMFCIVWLIGKYLPLTDVPLLFVQIICGGVVYVTLSIVTKNKEWTYIYCLFKNKFLR